MDMQTKVPMATDTNDDSVRVDDLVEDCFFPFYRRPHVDSTTPWIHSLGVAPGRCIQADSIAQ